MWSTYHQSKNRRQIAKMHRQKHQDIGFGRIYHIDLLECFINIWFVIINPGTDDVLQISYKSQIVKKTQSNCKKV